MKLLSRRMYSAGGGGSGYVKFGILFVSAGQTFNVTVGSGGLAGQQTVITNSKCNAATAGGVSTFGNIIAAQGGNSSDGANGGSGGSGGGSGAFECAGCFTGGGGSAGSPGNNSNTSFVGGSGQGVNFTSWFSQFQLTNISAGAGSVGLQNTELYRYGGGGGGGILLNGTGPSSGAGGCCSVGTCGPLGSAGYGAGGSAGCRNSNSNNNSIGGNGADGMVYIEFF